MGKDTSIKARCARVTEAIGTAYGIKSGSLRRASRRAGRLLPRRVRADIAVLLDAEERAQNPRLAATLDQGALARAERNALDWLSAIDRADARKGLWLGIAGTAAFNILAVAGLVIAWWAYRG